MKRLVVALVVALVLLGSTTAYAAWTTGASGSGRSSARAVGVPTSVTATALSSSSVTIDWVAPGGTSVTPTQYVVSRTAPTTATVCTVSAPTVTCTDTGLAPATGYSYTVAALVGTNWTSGPSATASATTSAAPTLELSATSSQTAGTAFNVTITATTNGVTTDTSYAGVKTLTFSGPANAPSGAAPTYPATVTFTAGVGTASVTLRKAETASLAATDGTRSGSVSITVTAATANRLGWSSSTPSCASGIVVVGVGGSFTSKVTVYDTFLNPKSGTNRTVTLSRSPNRGTLSVTSLAVSAANSETTNSMTYTRATNNAGNVTVTAAASGLTSTTCSVRQS